VELGAARACGERRPQVEFTAVVLWRMAAAQSRWCHARRRLGSIYKRSCLGEGFTTTRTSVKGQGMGTKGSTARRSTAPTQEVGRCRSVRLACVHEARGARGVGADGGSQGWPHRTRTDGCWPASVCGTAAGRATCMAPAS
jgi:hypothetical protein